MFALSITDYIHNLKQAGFSDQQSEIQARHFEQVAQIVKNIQEQVKEQAAHTIQKELELNTLATKHDLLVTEKKLELLIAETRKDLELSLAEVRREIAVLRHDTLKFVIWIGVSCSVAVIGMLGGMMAKGFHWF